ncbi:putative trans-sialidase [Trypanosoma cruzi]|nr:putative trans-sialidase [Trypanosoma cruzi]
MGKKKRETIKDPTELVRRRNDTLFAQVVVKSARAKEIQARANSGAIGGYCAPFRLFSQLLFHPKEEGWQNVILAATSRCIVGQRNKSSHIAGVKWPHHRISTSLSLGCTRASLHVPRRSSRSLSTGVLKCSGRLRATSQASQSLSVSQTTSSDFPPRRKSANARWLFIPRLDGVMFCVGSWRYVPLPKTASWRVVASCASPL